jgi:ribosomal protein S18 acetylase RimI-like enzyme
MLREANIEDANAIAELHVSSWQSTYAGHFPESYLASLSVPDRADMWRKIVQYPGSKVLLAVDENVLQGFVSYGLIRGDSSPSNIGEIYAIYLRKEFQGQGIGAQLWNGGIDSLKALMCTEAVVWVLDTNSQARQFYERMGCVLDGNEKQENIGGKDVVELRYTVVLS